MIIYIDNGNRGVIEGADLLRKTLQKNIGSGPPAGFDTSRLRMCLALIIIFVYQFFETWWNRNMKNKHFKTLSYNCVGFGCLPYILPPWSSPEANGKWFWVFGRNSTKGSSTLHVYKYTNKQHGVQGKLRGVTNYILVLDPTRVLSVLNSGFQLWLPIESPGKVKKHWYPIPIPSDRVLFDLSPKAWGFVLSTPQVI